MKIQRLAAVALAGLTAHVGAQNASAQSASAPDRALVVASHDSGGERHILYYRNPMGLPDTSPTPRKDSMGMDYIPVYSDEAQEHDDGAIRIDVERVQRAGVRAETVELRHLVRPVRAPGIVKFDERRLRSVTLRADAFVEKLYVNETGKAVKAGEPLFRIYSPQMVSAQIDYVSSLAAAAMTRDETLRSQGGAEQRLRNLETPEPVVARLRGKGTPVMSIDWPSPAEGVVIEKKVIEGQQLKMGDEAIRIANLDTVWVIAEVAEHDLGLVKVGAPAVLAFHAFPGMRVEGKVTFIAPMLDASARTGKVRIEASNPRHALRAEMYADVEIAAAAGEKPLVAAPVSAVIDSGLRQVVLVERGGGRFEPREVKLGLKGDGYVEVREGLAPGERVVTAANFLIDAESNLKAALRSFGPPAGGHEGHEGHEGGAAHGKQPGSHAGHAAAGGEGEARP